MADLGARAMAAAGPVAMAAAAGSHVWGRVVDTVRTSDPMVGDTYDKSYELAKARVGHDFAPAVDYASSALQAGSEFWSKGTPEAKRIRQFGLLAPLITPIGAAAVAAGFRTEPERSFAGLPSGGRTSLEQYALGLGGAAVSTGPLEQRLLEERYKSFTNPGGEKAWWDAPIAAGAGAGMAGLRALFDALTGNVRDVADNTEKDPHDFGRW